jgi:membrane protein DedA with SNARE-associated domain
MITTWLTHLAHVPALVAYGFVFVWLAAESCGLPLPNELVLLLLGSLAAQPGHSVSPLPLALFATCGSLAGSYGAYLIGLRGGRSAVLRLGRYIRLDDARLDSVEARFARTGGVAIFLARITPFVRTVASFPAGMLRLSRRTFLIATALGSLIWCAVLVTLGDLLGANYLVALRLIQRYSLLAVLVLLALGAGYVWLHSRLAHTTPAAAPGELDPLGENE